MPRYLSALGAVGEEESPGLELIEAHFSSRLRQGFELGEITSEFSLLGRCVLQTWFEAPEEMRPDFTALERILAALQSASAFVTEMFNRHQLEDAQEEKRHLRLVRSVFDQVEARAAGEPRTFSECLHAAVGVVMAAMGAHAAAVLLYEPTREELVTMAAAGLANQGLARHVRALKLSSFVGHFARHEEATTLEDIATTQLDVPQELRHSGIHSLLGVRMPPHHALLGVVLIGIREQRSFTARETRRIEVLAEALALYIENAQLNETLARQIDALREEQRLRDVFVSLIAHDLRGPISAARLAAQLMDMQADHALSPEDLRRRVAMVVRNLDRSERMIRDLLDTQRLQAGQLLPIVRQPCDLTLIAREVVDDLAQQHHDRLTLVEHGPVAGLWGEDELRRAIWNLTMNALKYGSTVERVSVEIRLSAATAEVAVHNAGVAIPPAEQARLFKPFNRAHEGGTVHGWGLGLAVVDGVAAAHGGNVTVDSAPERGTTFTLRLPVITDAASA
ncbi:Hypothetical protein CAP_1557 [Chondromyces apiculatus DSM 436]|uniref:histidine kinase n=2 Tax=Chondromyces apiculatus TaxID=51 RepID=A0A017TDG7_9BACT|nr:Hypothetical protein CAP_1557 [Chondromyces apiculatus DSM 436]